MKEAMFTCACCHEEHPMSQYQEASGEPVCPNCLEDETVICSSCGTRIWKDDNAGDDNTPLCQRCYDRYYTVCDHCGAVIPYENVRYAAIDEDEEFPYVMTVSPIPLENYMPFRIITISHPLSSMARVPATLV